MIRIHGWVLPFSILLSTGCVERAESRANDSAMGDVDLSIQTGTAVRADDPLAQRADSLLRTGHAWRATALLAPRLTTPATDSPELRLVGARAAAGWEGWTEVERLLRDAPWLDSQYGGEGRELLTRSALERGTDALPDAQRALAAARDEANRVTRRVLLARAQDRANQRDSAAANYLAAAAKPPCSRASAARRRARELPRRTRKRASVTATWPVPHARSDVRVTKVRPFASKRSPRATTPRSRHSQRASSRSCRSHRAALNHDSRSKCSTSSARAHRATRW